MFYVMFLLISCLSHLFIHHSPSRSLSLALTLFLSVSWRQIVVQHLFLQLFTVGLQELAARLELIDFVVLSTLIFEIPIDPGFKSLSLSHSRSLSLFLSQSTLHAVDHTLSIQRLREFKRQFSEKQRCTE